jgi:hypothetical protein
MLRILNSKGAEESYVLITPGQYFRFWKLIEDESDEILRKKYQFIFWAQIAIVPVYLIGLFLLFTLS